MPGVETLEELCFSETGIARIRIPEGVRDVGDFAFCACARLEKVQFSENSRLRRIGLGAFAGTKVCAFSAPASLRKLCQGALCQCRCLRVVVLNDGLEQLGTDECDGDGYACRGVFQNSAVESVVLPTTLRRIARATFKGC